MHQPGITDASVARAIDEAVLKYYPDYAAAASISGMVQELVKGVVDLYFTLDEQVRQLQALGGGYEDEFVDFTANEALELVDLAYSIYQTRLTASAETKKLLLSTFFDDTVDYRHCIDMLLRCAVFK